MESACSAQTIVRNAILLTNLTATNAKRDSSYQKENAFSVLLIVLFALHLMSALLAFRDILRMNLINVGLAWTDAKLV